MALTGCTNNSSEDAPATTDQPKETTVGDNQAYISYDSLAYREVFDYEEERSRDLLTNSPSHNGSALEVPIPEGQHRGMRMRFWFADHFSEEPEAASATYWLYVPKDFEFAASHSGGGKLPGFQGTYGNCGAGDLGPCDGSDGWSARMSFIRPKAAYLDTDIGLAHYVYHGEMNYSPTYPYGTYLRWNRGLTLGEWHRIDQFVQMNTLGNHDGILRGWVNGKLALDRDGLLFRGAEAEDIRIEEFVNTVYFGGQWPSPVDNAMYFGDLEIRTGPPESSSLDKPT
ncbi:polysaccharide lyase [Natronoarchaeum sp. GCM10025703]|uniref:polysaccharide lyase n=1 Tax=unclassified Natronoarchaeum TaxID=2620183 RepID=UPI00361E7620